MRSELAGVYNYVGLVIKIGDYRQHVSSLSTQCASPALKTPSGFTMKHMLLAGVIPVRIFLTAEHCRKCVHNWDKFTLRASGCP